MPFKRFEIIQGFSRVSPKRMRIDTRAFCRFVSGMKADVNQEPYRIIQNYRLKEGLEIKLLKVVSFLAYPSSQKPFYQEGRLPRSALTFRHSSAAK